MYGTARKRSVREGQAARILTLLFGEAAISHSVFHPRDGSHCSFHISQWLKLVSKTRQRCESHSGARRSLRGREIPDQPPDFAGIAYATSIDPK